MSKTLLITGSRNVTYEQTRDLEGWLLREITRHGITCILHGDANGVDDTARYVAHDLGVEQIVIKPNYARYGKGAPLQRNSELVRQARRRGARVIAWQPNGPTPGAQDTVKKAIAAGLTVEEWRGSQWIRHVPAQMKMKL